MNDMNIFVWVVFSGCFWCFLIYPLVRMIVDCVVERRRLNNLSNLICNEADIVEVDKDVETVPEVTPQIVENRLVENHLVELFSSDEVKLKTVDVSEEDHYYAISENSHSFDEIIEV